MKRELPHLRVCVDRTVPDQAAALPVWQQGRTFGHDCAFLDGTARLRRRVEQYARDASSTREQPVWIDLCRRDLEAR